MHNGTFRDLLPRITNKKNISEKNILIPNFLDKDGCKILKHDYNS